MTASTLLPWECSSFLLLKYNQKKSMFRNKLFIKHHAVTRDSGFKTILHSYVCTFVIIIINEEKISEKGVIMIKKIMKRLLNWIQLFMNWSMYLIIEDYEFSTIW